MPPPETTDLVAQEALPPLTSPHAKGLPPDAIAAIQRVKIEQQMVRALLDEVLIEGKDYGIIPGTKEPTLLQPGAQKVGQLLKLKPQIVTTFVDLGNGHRDFRATCKLVRSDTGEVDVTWARSCNTMESKYRYRNRKRSCPHCGEELRKSKPDRGGGYYCWVKTGGCGWQCKKGTEDFRQIEALPVGREENPDIADTWSTVEAMAAKRAFVNAVNASSACSDIFTVESGEFDSGTEDANGEPSERTAALELLERTLIEAGATGNALNQRMKRSEQMNVTEIHAWVERIRAAKPSPKAPDNAAASPVTAPTSLQKDKMEYLREYFIRNPTYAADFASGYQAVKTEADATAFINTWSHQWERMQGTQTPDASPLRVDDSEIEGGDSSP